MSTMQERREVMSQFPDVHIEHHRIIGVIPTVRAEYKCNGIPWYENLFAGQSTCRMESAQTHTLGMMPKITGRKQFFFHRRNSGRDIGSGTSSPAALLPNGISPSIVCTAGPL